MSGKYFTQAFQHLHALDLRGRAASINANELGSSIRHRFSDPFLHTSPIKNGST